MLKSIWGFLGKLRRDHVDAFAAQTAYFTMLSFIPFLILLISLVQYIPDSKAYFIKAIELSMPDYLKSILLGIINEMYSKSFALVSLTAVVALWTSAKGIQYLTDGLNSVYEIEETRSWFRLRFRAAINTVFMVLAIVGLLIIMIFGDWLQSNLAKEIPFVNQITQEILSNRVMILMLLLIFVFDIFYTILPNRRATLLGQLPGAVFCSVCWIVFSWLISIYVNKFNGFSIYGSLTVLVLIMFWLYFCMYFIMVGGAINFYFNALFRRLRQKLRAWRRERREARRQFIHNHKERRHTEDQQVNAEDECGKTSSGSRRRGLRDDGGLGGE